MRDFIRCAVLDRRSVDGRVKPGHDGISAAKAPPHLDLKTRRPMLVARRKPPCRPSSGKPLIVISYAHADEPETPAEGEVKWLSFVTGYLRPAIKHGAADLWLDRLMLGGAEWEAEIEHKLRACDVFILLVSRHSLSSDYVVDKEIALIRERQAKGEKVHFYPLILTPTPKIALDLVRDRNLRPRDGKPFSDYSVNDRYRHMNEAADEIADIANAIAANPAQPGRRQSRQESAAGPPLDPVDPVQAAEPGDQQSLQRWMRRRHPDVVLTIAARAALRVAPLVYHARQERVGAAPARELDDLLCTVLRALAPAQLAPQVFHADEFRPAFHAAADKAEAAARRAAYSTARAVCQSVSAVAAAAATRFDDQTPRAAFAAQAVTLAAEASARGAADHAALIVRELSRRTDADRVDDDVGGRRERDNATRAAATAAEGSGAAALWEEVQADLAWAEGFDPDALDADATKNRPLWAHGQPDWVRNVWSSFKAEASLAQPWDVWIAWYEERLRGVAREEAYEAVFAGVPTEEWNKGPSAANGWIRQRLGQVQTTPAITDRETLAAWLDGKAPQVAVAMAARAALRAVPLLATPKLEIAPQELEERDRCSLSSERPGAGRGPSGSVGGQVERRSVPSCGNSGVSGGGPGRPRRRPRCGPDRRRRRARRRRLRPRRRSRSRHGRRRSVARDTLARGAVRRGDRRGRWHWRAHRQATLVGLSRPDRTRLVRASQ